MTSQYNKSTKKFKSSSRHLFLLSFFDKPDTLEHKEIHGFILQRYFNKGSGNWEVMVYTQDSWQKAQFWNKKNRLTPKRQTKFHNLFSELNNAVQHKTK